MDLSKLENLFGERLVISESAKIQHNYNEIRKNFKKNHRTRGASTVAN